LIREKLEAKASEHAQVRLSQSLESIEKLSKLTHPDATQRAMAKVDPLVAAEGHGPERASRVSAREH
jgi:hypothetical protein